MAASYSLAATQIVTRFIVDPLIEFRRLIGEVTYTLILNAQYLYNANASIDSEFQAKFEDAKRQCRALASRLHAFSAAVPLYSMLSRVGLVPPQANVEDAAAQLIGLSNTRPIDSVDFVDQRYKTISKLLRIRVST